jgi:hypothetical protein
MNKEIYKTTVKKSLFDEQFSAEKLVEIGNPLEMIVKNNQHFCKINWFCFVEKSNKSIFRTHLN